MKAALLVVLLTPCILAQQAVDRVNVFTGTSNSRWMQFPGATLPMGMVKMSPDNQANVWDGGYEYTVGSIAGFSFLHTLGLSTFTVMPLAGPLENEPGQPKLFPGPSDGPFGQMWTSGYRSRIDKQTETGRPGYYAVDLLDAHTRMELTATERTGWMRFTQPSDRPTHLLFDFAAPAEEQTELLRFTAYQVAPDEIAGFMTQRNGYAGEFTVFFDTRLSRPIASMSSWQNGDLPPSSASSYGTEWRRPSVIRANVTEIDSTRPGGIWLDFDPASTAPIVLKTGISLVGAQQAHDNLASETDKYGFDFDRVAVAASHIWQQLLSRVELEGGSSDDQTKLYTSLYRAYTGKAILDDTDGGYRDDCGEIQRLPTGVDHVYSTDALWGAQWTLGPLWDLLTPEIATSFDKALLMQAQRGGWLPDVTVNMRYASIMDAQHSMAMITGAWQKGLHGFDGEAAYTAMRKVATTPGELHTCNGRYPGGFVGDRHRAAYLKLGYVPEEEGPASSTFEYAFDDSCVATLARSLGHAADAALFTRRAANWRNGLSPVTLYAQRRRADGTWVEPNDIHRFGTTGGWTGPGFLEGTAWIYSWFVPQDVPALIAAVGKDRFNQRLEEGFAKRYVDLTNEPNLQAPWLFNYSGKPWLTQRHARDVFSRVFDTSPLNGWPGEEDEGQMGAYVVLAGLGLFDMEGGCTATPAYQISGPAFSKVTLHLSGGHDFTIAAPNNSPANIYIQSAKLNGVPLSVMHIAHAEVARGGLLEMRMGPTPSSTAIH